MDIYQRSYLWASLSPKLSGKSRTDFLKPQKKTPDPVPVKQDVTRKRKKTSKL